MRIPTVLLALSLMATPLVAADAKGKEVLPFIANDFPGALKAAKARNVPLFVETWAPW